MSNEDEGGELLFSELFYLKLERANRYSRAPANCETHFAAKSLARSLVRQLQGAGWLAGSSLVGDKRRPTNLKAPVRINDTAGRSRLGRVTREQKWLANVQVVGLVSATGAIK